MAIIIQAILLILNMFLPDPIPYIDETIQIIILIITIIAKPKK